MLRAEHRFTLGTYVFSKEVSIHSLSLDGKGWGEGVREVMCDA
jgi:hypothetical protein